VLTPASLPDGLVNTAYDQTLQASGGTGARTWSITSGALPDDLALDPATGQISGTPPIAGVFDFAVQVQDSAAPPHTATRNHSIRIIGLLEITTVSLPNGSGGVPYNADLVASGGRAPYLWTHFGNPSGLDLAERTTTTENNTLSGTTTIGGTFNITIQIEDSFQPPQSAEKIFTVRFLRIMTFTLPNSVQSLAYGPIAFAVTGQVDPVGWSEPTNSFDAAGLGATGTACEGLQIDFNNGTLSGTPVRVGTCDFTLRVTDSDSPPRSDDQVLSVLVAGELQITTAALPNAETGVAYDQTVQTSGGVPPLHWNETTGWFDSNGGAVSTPCEGLRLDFSTGNISGSPVNPGLCGPFTLQVIDSASPAQVEERTLSITVNVGPLVITTGALPAGAVNRTYVGEIEAAGGTPPLTWSEPTGSFDSGGVGAAATPCEGLTLNLTAIAASTSISGTPVNQGTCGLFTIQVDDSALDSDTKDFTIEVGPEPVAVRNDTVANATDLGSAPGVNDPRLVVTASISPFGGAVPGVTPNAADNDFYRLASPAGATLRIETIARRLSTDSPLDSVIELVTDNGSDLGTRILAACRESGNDSTVTTGNINGVTGVMDTTPIEFDDQCINDDIVLGVERDSRLEFRVPTGQGDPFTFFIRVLDWRGDARPDFLYELRVDNVD